MEIFQSWHDWCGCWILVGVLWGVEWLGCKSHSPSERSLFRLLCMGSGT